MLHAPIIADRRLVPDDAPLELAVVIPTRNEADNVETLLASLQDALADIVWEAIFVDDNSTDGTARLIRDIGRLDIRVRVLQRIGRRGLASAVIEGMLATSAPVLAVIDADMQHDETLLPKLYRAVACGDSDLAVGSRYAEGGGTGDWNGQRLSASRLATHFAHAITGTQLSDPMSGYFVVSREVVEAALPRLFGTGFKILVDLVASSPKPLRVVELPYVFRDRTHGESKLDLLVAGEFLAFLVDRLVGRFVPIRLVLFMMVGTFGLGIHLGVLRMVLALGASFAVAQAMAVWTAMTCNFALNNIFTYRDRRLRGWRLAMGLLSFYAICLFGAAANVGVGAWVNDTRHCWWLAGVAGALIGAVWNFAASSALTWRK